MSIQGLSVLLNNLSGGPFIIGSITIPAGNSLQIWDTVNYTNVAANFQAVLNDISTLNQALFDGNLVMIVNSVTLSTDDAFAQFHVLETAYQTNPADDFALVRMEGQSALGLTDIVLTDGTVPLGGNLQMDGYSIVSVNLINGVDITNHHARHQSGGADAIDGYNIGILYSPHGYPAPVDNILGEHIARIDAELVSIENNDSGYVTGPGSASDGYVARFNGTSGKIIENSSVAIDSSGNVTTAGTYNGVTVQAHAARHQQGGADQIDGYNVHLAYSPVNYPAPFHNIIGEHLSKIDTELCNWSNVAAALGGQAGSNDGYIFRSNGMGSGNMVPFNRIVTNVLTVGQPGDDVQYHSIAEATAVAIAGGASVSNSWQIIVYPGTYIEPPFTISDGVLVIAHEATGTQPAFIIAANPSEDLITMTGGDIKGFTAIGVTDPAKCVIRAATPGSVCAVEIFTVEGCSNGIIVSNGAQMVSNILSVIVGAPGIQVGTWVTATDPGSIINISTLYVNVPSAILPFYSPANPIQTLLRATNGAQINVAAGSIVMPDNDGTSDVFLADEGSLITALSVAISDSNNVFHIGSAGSNTVITAGGCLLNGNTKNVVIDSSSGIAFCEFTTDSRKISLVAGANQIGTIKYTSESLIQIVGKFFYTYLATNKDADVADFLYDGSSTGLDFGGIVSYHDGYGLTVSVTAGEGWIRRAIFYSDTYSVSWSAVPSLALTASATNYVYYDSDAAAVVAHTAPPSDTGILLATVVTDGYGVRFNHQTRIVRTDIYGTLQNYLLTVSPQFLKSGLATIQGSTNRRVNVGSGSYYLGLDTVTYDGYDGYDAIWSYFYGSGANEIKLQNQVDITNYDNSGTLTTMSDGYYRIDYLILTSDGRLSLIYGTSQYTSLPMAEAGNAPNIPPFILPSNMPLAKLFVQKNTGIALIQDARPTRSTGGGSSGGVTVHSQLAGLDADDHKQYLLVNGSRAMSGDLSMGGHNIISVGTVDGVDVSNHAARHNPGGLDALATGVPVAISVGASPSAGTGSSYALNDHQHGIAAAAPVNIGTANAAGSASSVARSDHVHAISFATVNSVIGTADAAISVNSQQITNLATPSVATDAVNKGYVDGYFVSILSNTTPQNDSTTGSAGTSNLAARADHYHGISFATVNSIIGTANASISVNSQKITNLATPTVSTDAVNKNYVDGYFVSNLSNSSPANVGTASAVGTATTCARADHVHALTFSTLNSVIGAANAGISVNNQQINNLATPTLSTDAVNKSYVDGYFSSFGSSILSSSTPSNVGTAGSAGAGTTAARFDHVHALTFTTVNTVLGTANSSIGVNNQKITSLATPTVSSDAVNKSYVDGYFVSILSNTAATAVTSGAAIAGTSNFASRSDHAHNISFGTINTVIGTANAAISVNSQQINNLASPTLATDAANKSYVDGYFVSILSNATPGAVATAGSAGTSNFASRSDHVHALAFATVNSVLGTANASISVNSQKITSLAAPTVSTDAANKNYVDGYFVSILSNTTPSNSDASAGSAGTSNFASRSDHTHQINVGSPVNVGTANANGSSNSLSRTDHVHALSFATLNTVIGTANAAISVNSQQINNLANPSLATDAVNKSYVDGYFISILSNATPGAVGTAGSAGTSNLASRSDHVHALAFATVNTVLGTANASISVNSQKITSLAAPTVSTDAVNKNYVDGYFVSILSNTTPSNSDASAGSAGTSNFATRSDHTHQINVGTPTNIGTANANGTSNSLVRADHVHALSFATLNSVIGTANASISVNSQKITSLATPTVSTDAATKGYVDGYFASNILSSTTPANVGTAGVIGVGTTAARADHVHALTFATLNTVIGTANAAISVNSQQINNLSGPTLATDAVNKNYVDGYFVSILSNATPTTIDASAGAAGTSNFASRSDHDHQINVGTPTNVGTANANGSANTLVRSDHVHALSFATLNTIIGTANASISVNSQKITSLATPTLATDAVNKSYVDGYFISILSNANPAAVGTVANDGSSNLASRSDHVHALAFATVNTVLGTANASISVNNQRITSLATPFASTDAANKSYVDGYTAAVLSTHPLGMINSTTLNVFNSSATWGGLVFAQINMAITSMSVWVYQSGSTGNVQCGIYDAVSNTLLGTTSAVSATSIGIKVMTFSTPVTLTKGSYYYLAVACTSNGSLLVGTTNTASTFNITPKPSVIQNSSQLPATLSPSVNSNLVWIQAWE